MIFVPIFLPLLDDFGVDPLSFGVLIALNLPTSFLSPPVAMAAFHLNGVAPEKWLASSGQPDKWISCLRAAKLPRMRSENDEAHSDARASLGRYLDFYNARRPQSSLGARTPEQAYLYHLPQQMAA